VKIGRHLWNDNIAFRYSKQKQKQELIAQGKKRLLSYSEAKNNFMSELLLLARRSNRDR
jgi:hypothetical protein